MASILDIAKKAGVSHGTVSNVLNKKGNVSAEKIRLVEEAAIALNYSRNNEARTLREGKSNHVALIIGSFNIEEYMNFYKGLEYSLADSEMSIDLFENPSNIKEFNNLLNSLMTSKYKKIILLGVDHEIKSDEKIHIIKNDFSDDINEYRKSCKIYKYTSSTKEQELDIISKSEMLAHLENDYIVLIHNNTYQKFIEKCQYYGIDIKSKIILVSERVNPNVDTMIISKYYQHGIDIGTAIEDDSKLEDVSFKTFKYEAYESKIKSSKKVIKIVSNNNPTVNALVNVAKNFTMLTGINVEIDVLSHDEIYDLIKSELISNYDFVRIDISIYPYFANEKFVELRDLTIVEGKDDVFNNLIERIVGSDLTKKGVPFDTSIQSFMYRKDLFEDELFKRTFYESYKKVLKVPTTITEYIEVVDFINDNPNFNFECGNSMNIKDPNVISSDYLSIYYGLGGTLVGNDGIKVDPVIGEEALNHYFTLRRKSLRNNTDWFTQAIEDYSNSRTPMIFGYSNQIMNISKYDVIDHTEVTLIPGSNPMLGGGILSMVKTSPEAEDFLTWFLNPYTKYALSQNNGVCTNGNLIDQIYVSNKYYHLNKAIKQIKNTIRETYDNDKNPIDIYSYERLIGKMIRANDEFENDIIIERINERLKEEWGK